MPELIKKLVDRIKAHNARIKAAGESAEKETKPKPKAVTGLPKPEKISLSGEMREAEEKIEELRKKGWIPPKK